MEKNFETQVTVTEIFAEGDRLGCSDVIVKPGSRPRFRVNGSLVDMEDTVPLTSREAFLLSHKIMSEKVESEYFAAEYDYDFSLDYTEENLGRYRVNVYKTQGSDAFVARRLSEKAKTLDSLGVPPIVKDLSLKKNGVILVTGPTGSGKSSTLAGMIDYINENKNLHIISIENPVEILHQDKKASISQREVHTDVKDFSDALKSALRQDPDVIVVGEIRDLETMKIVMLAADTGHLVISTLHTTDAVEAINRVVNMYESSEHKEIRRLFSASLRGIISQRLVKTTNGGRIAVNEILVNTHEISDALLDENMKARDMKILIEKNTKFGMQTFEQSLEKLIREGKTTVDLVEEEFEVSDKIKALRNVSYPTLLPEHTVDTMPGLVTNNVSPKTLPSSTFVNPQSNKTQDAVGKRPLLPHKKSRL